MSFAPPPPPPIDNCKDIKKVKPIELNPDELKGVSLIKVSEKDKKYIFSIHEEDNPFNFIKGENGSVRIELKESAAGDLEKVSQYSEMLGALFNHNVSLKNFEEQEYSWKIWHGCLGNESWKPPVCAVKTGFVNRQDQGNSTNASEYLDEPDVLDEKMKIVADLILKSKCCTVYTGAGISRGAGIPDYASKAEDSLVKEVEEIEDPYDANPTFSHIVLANLEREKYVHHYVQQNHDGLPQKAGFPQEKMNEIHGAWFDPSNPVVQFSGKLRHDLYSSMMDIEKKTDLCICLGTSLSGMNADRCIKTPIRRFARGIEGSLGGVIVNLQMTPVDQGKVSIRVWARIDDAMKLLVKHLGMKVKNLRPRLKQEIRKNDMITCPYDKNGILLDERRSKKKMVLNLQKGQRVRICQKGAMNEGRIGKIIGKDKNGNYKILFARKKKKGFVRRFGYWWLNTIRKGKVKSIPLVNVKPRFV